VRTMFKGKQNIENEVKNTRVDTSRKDSIVEACFEQKRQETTLQLLLLVHLARHAETSKDCLNFKQQAHKLLTTAALAAQAIVAGKTSKGCSEAVDE